MAQKTISIKATGSNKWEKVSILAYLKAVGQANEAGNDIRIKGRSYQGDSAQLDPNSVDATETINSSVSPNSLIVSTVADAGNPLAPLFALAAGATLNIAIKQTTTGAVNLAVNGGLVKEVKKNGVAMGANELVSGSTIEVKYDGAEWRITTDETVAAAKNVSGAAGAPSLATASGLQLFKFSKTFGAFQPNATTIGEIDLGLLPIGAFPVAIKIKHSIQWSGGGISSVVARVKVGAQQIAYEGNLFTAPSNVNGTLVAVNSGGTIPDQTAPSQLKLNLTTTTAAIDALTQGSVDVWVVCFVAV